MVVGEKSSSVKRHVNKARRNVEYIKLKLKRILKRHFWRTFSITALISRICQDAYVPNITIITIAGPKTPSGFFMSFSDVSLLCQTSSLLKRVRAANIS